MGEASAAAQNLKNPITSGAKMMAAEGQTIYMLVDRAETPMAVLEERKRRAHESLNVLLVGKVE